MASPLQKILVLTLKFLLLPEEKHGYHAQREVELSKQPSLVRIHVESVIGLMKNKYFILKRPLPICLLKHEGRHSS